MVEVVVMVAVVMELRVTAVSLKYSGSVVMMYDEVGKQQVSETGAKQLLSR